jgi:hypothetical protein
LLWREFYYSWPELDPDYRAKKKQANEQVTVGTVDTIKRIRKTGVRIRRMKRLRKSRKTIRRR